MPDAPTGDLSVKHLLQVFGGAKGLLDSSLPILVFVVVNLFASLNTSIAAAVAAGVAIVVLRKSRGESLQQAFSGFFGLVLAVVIARFTGSGKGIFLSGILITAGSGVVFGLSLLVRKPIIAMGLEAIDPRYKVWSTHPVLKRAVYLATAAWTVSFFIRATVASIVYASVGSDGSDNVVIYVVINAVKWPLIIGCALLTVALVKAAEVPPVPEEH